MLLEVRKIAKYRLNHCWKIFRFLFLYIYILQMQNKNLLQCTLFHCSHFYVLLSLNLQNANCQLSKRQLCGLKCILSKDFIFNPFLAETYILFLLLLKTCFFVTIKRKGVNVSEWVFVLSFLSF